MSAKQGTFPGMVVLAVCGLCSLATFFSMRRTEQILQQNQNQVRYLQEKLDALESEMLAGGNGSPINLPNTSRDSPVADKLCI